MEFSKDLFQRRIKAQLSREPTSAYIPSVVRSASLQSAAVTRKEIDELVRISEDRAFLEAAYRRLLSRECDISGMANHLDALRNHVPRRVVIQRLLDSDEGQRKGLAIVSEAILPHLSVRSRLQRWRGGLTASLRMLVRRVLLARFDSIDYKISFLMEELTSRTDALSRKVDESLWTSSEKQDVYAADQRISQEKLEASMAAFRDEAITRIEAPVRAREERGRVLAETLALANGINSALAAATLERNIEKQSLRELRQAVQLVHDRVDATATLKDTVDNISESVVGLKSQIETLVNRLKVIESGNAATRSSLSSIPPQIDRILAASREAAKSDQESFASILAASRETAKSDQECFASIAASQHTLQGVLDSISAGLARPPAEALPQYPPLVSSPPSADRPGVLATLVDEMIVGVPASEWRVAAFHVFRGTMEPGLLRLFHSLVKPGMIVADVGANVGIYTLAAARELAGDGRVHSFEPVPAIHDLLRGNVQVNGFLETGVVRFSRKAVTDRVGTAEFTVFPNDSGHSTLFWPNPQAEKITVETTSLDDELGLEKKLDVVKIDAEGAEKLIWAGMKSLLSQNPGIQILMEFAPSHLDRAGVDPAEFIREIQSSGFAIARVHELTGELLSTSASELTSFFSSNLYLSREQPN